VRFTDFKILTFDTYGTHVRVSRGSRASAPPSIARVPRMGSTSDVLSARHVVQEASKADATNLHQSERQLHRQLR